MSAARSATLSELAALVQGELRADAKTRITGVAPLRAAGPGDISWLSDPRHAQRLAETKAAAVLVPRTLADIQRPAVVCASVDHALAQVMNFFAPPVPAPPRGIDPTARIADDAELGADVAIGPYAVVGAKARIGARTVLDAGVVIGAETTLGTDCRLWPYVVVRERCQLGDRVVIHPHAVIGADGFGYYLHEGRHRRVPHIGGVVIGSDVEIGAGSCVDRSKTGNTVVGDGVKIDNLVQVAHNVVIGAHSVLCAQVGVAGSARLGQYVVLGGHVGIRDNIALGDGVQVAACSCVPQDVDAGAKVAGLPAIEFRQYLRENASLRKLPDIVGQLRELIRRVEELEGAADNPPNG